MTKAELRRKRDRRGQGLVEFALVFPVFLLILFGMIDLGAFVFSNDVMSQAAREGARLASAEAGWINKTIADDPSCNKPGGPICPTLANFPNDVLNAVKRNSGGLTSTITVYVRCDPPGFVVPDNWTTGSCAANNSKGNLVSVRVVYNFNPLTPVGRSAIGTPSRSGAATMVIN